MNIYVKTSAAAALIALGFFAGRVSLTFKPSLGALALAPDAPESLLSVELPPEAPAKIAPKTSQAAVDTTPIGAIDPAPSGGADPARDAPPNVAIAPPPPRPELSRFEAAAALYRKGDRAGGDALAGQIAEPLQRAALDWVALKSAPDRDHLLAFEAAHKDWPAADWMRETEEGWLYGDHAPAATVEAFFAREPPQTPLGAVAALRAALEAGRKDEAVSQLRALWRDQDLDVGFEGRLLKEFGVLLTRADHKYRADRLLYAEKIGAAMRAASLAGADEVALANARVEAMRGPLSPRAIAAVPATLQSDPGLIFARVQDARRANRTAEAAAWIALAPRDPAALIDPDKWWTERRMVAREWLDRGAFKQAYDLCAGAAAVSVPAKVDAEFHAGWIALRFLNDPAAAAGHFEQASAVALTPLAHARADYWRGRAAEALNKPGEAQQDYERAAAYPIAYYGQLAARKLGRETAIAPRARPAAATGDARAEAARIVELYYDAGLDDFAASLAFAAARNWRDESQIAALGETIARRGDARTNVTFGKIATERGFALDETAFPTFGLPRFAPLAHSADIASVLAVARQESEFSWRAASGAGAKGLMQILPGTAEMTARRAGVPYDFSRLISDPAFNLQLGAAYLGQLIEDEGGSFEMALAAYNAGAGRVAQWISIYGDPRSGAVDPVDWVERIPFDETRDYVERVSENLGIYRARLSAPPEAGPGGRLARE
jgi:soluble lytic murein transglycosylase